MNSTRHPLHRVAGAILIGVIAGCILFAFSVTLFDIQLPFGLGDRTESHDLEISTNPSDLEHSVVEDLQIESVLDTLVSLQQIESKFDRQVSLDRLLKSASLQRLVGMLEVSADINNAYHRTFIQTNILRKLATKNPQLALLQIDTYATIKRQEYLGAVFNEWSYIDLSEMIDHAKTLYFEDRFIVLSALIQMRNDLPEKVIREIGKTLGLKDQAAGMLRERKVTLMHQNPNEIFMASLGDDIDDNEQVDVLAQSAKAWVIRDGIQVLPDIVTSVLHWEVRRDVLRTVFSYRMSINPQETFALAKKLLDSTDKTVFNQLASYWAKREPVVALSTVSQLDSDELRHELQDTVVNEWAKARPMDLLANLDLVPNRLRTNARSDAILVLSEITPSDIAHLLTRVEDGEIALSRQLVRDWSKHDAQQAFSWVLTNSALSDDLRQELLRDTIVALSRERPHQALQMAITLPTDESGIGPEARIVSRLASKNMEEAQAMLPHVREGPTKLSAYLAVGRELLGREPPRAIELGLELSNSQKTMYFGTIVGYWFLLDSDVAYESIGTLPSAEAKSKAAQQVLHNDRIVEYLTDAQSEQLHRYLNEEDAKNLTEINGELLID